MKDIVKGEVKDTESLPSGNNDYLLTIKVCLNNSSVSTVWAPLILKYQKVRQMHHLMFPNYSVVILPVPGNSGHIPDFINVFKITYIGNHC